MPPSGTNSPGSKMAWLLRALDAFTPAEIGEDQRRRCRLLVASAFGLCVFALPLIVQLYITLGRFNLTMGAFLVGALLMAVNPLLLRRTGSLRGVGAAMCIELSLILAVQAYGNGGIASASLIWGLVVPLLASLLVSPRFAMGSAAAMALLILAMYLAGEYGVVFPRPLSDAHMRWWTMAGLFSATLFIGGLGWLYEASYAAAWGTAQKAIAQLQQNNIELQEARDIAERAADTKAAFLANMSHEIRTPMNAVIGITSVLLDSSLDSRQRDYVETIRSSGETLLTLVNEILDFSKLEAGQVTLEEQPFELRACIEDALSIAAPANLQRGVELTYAIEADVPAWIEGDTARVKQVLLNLLSNALKFTPEGEVVVEAGITEGDEPGAARQLSLAVRDTGIGIPGDHLQHVFDSFTQVDGSAARRHGGSGLGLAIVKRVVERMQGRVRVHSQPGAGSLFEVLLPLRPVDYPAQPRASSWGDLQGRRVLVVDDNATQRRLLAAQVRAWGMHPDVFASGAEALAALDTAETVHVGLLDEHMPGMDGHALAEAIRERFGAGELPLILLTANTGSVDGETAGLCATVAKPIRQSALYDALMLALSGRPSHQTPPPPPRLSPQGEGSRLRILLAEDNLVNQKVALALLQRLGHRADVAANGHEVLQALDRQRYDVVLMDIQMPEMDGLEAARRIAARHKPKPFIVAMTAGALKSDRDNCLRAGMDDYITKPVRPAALEAALGKLSQLWVERAEHR